MAKSNEIPKAFVLLIPTAAAEKPAPIPKAESEENVQSISDDLSLWTQAPGWGPQDEPSGSQSDAKSTDKTASK